ncbi:MULTISPECIES: hypothetical protein [Burkholderia]|uniref:Uncharacterized protein n=1 Tax=Burkholderia pyrrocinia TaxID=60550 RepID=A0A318I0J9_BURPY|nr:MULTISPECIES: hypothetical protein [Burkholderia]PXX22876.1 hypothetical protein NA66_10377 [Burkholderia pyrrocinia]SFW89055.1 hypothetical protein SAMN03159384_06746 [Burkholderia sp. NFACC33-1]SFY46207.1 hypothetical protein SAMN03159408_06742 [Burkholderia sp. NFPP32]
MPPLIRLPMTQRETRRCAMACRNEWSNAVFKNVYGNYFNYRNGLIYFRFIKQNFRGSKGV